MGIKIGNTDISKIKIASGLTPRLPNAYQEVEWIGNSGTQYIDTGVAVPNHKAITNIEYTSFNGWITLGSYLGPDSGVPGGHVRLYGGRAGTTGKFCYGLLSAYAESGGNVSVQTKYELELSTISGNMYFKHDGITYGTSSATYSTSLAGNFGILAQNNTQTREIWDSAKVYDYKIYDSSDTLLRDFIPCYRIADGVIGMYDLVNDTFYTNAGSGVFTKGNDVYPELYKDIRKVYKGSTQVRPTVGPRTPGANTIAYYPFTSTDTIQDKSGNGNNLTNSGATFQTFNGVDCMFCDGTSKSVSGNITGIPQGANVRTFNFWCYNNQATPLALEMYFTYGEENTNKMVMLYCDSDDGITQYGAGGTFGTALRSQWFNLCLVYDGSRFLEYINGSHVGDWIYTINTTGTLFKIYGRSGWSDGSKYYSNFIIENKARTAQEISDYFDQTKADYGIS